jgi:hypothetical protein
VNRRKKKLEDPRNLIRLIGIIQLLNKYAQVSLTAQSATYFPSQVLGKIQETQAYLRELSQSWSWEELRLVPAGIRAPASTIEQLVEEGLYVPEMTRGSIRSYRQLEEAGLIEEGQTIDDLFLNGEQIQPLAGDMCVEGCTEEMVKEEEAYLETLAGSIVDTWETRQTITELDK